MSRFWLAGVSVFPCANVGTICEDTGEALSSLKERGPPSLGHGAKPAAELCFHSGHVVDCRSPGVHVEDANVEKSEMVELMWKNTKVPKQRYHLGGTKHLTNWLPQSI